MKKGLFIMIAAGALLVSCGDSTEKVAAQEFCDCYDGVLKAKESAGDASSTDELFGSSSAMVEETNKAMACLGEWQKKYDGKVEQDKIKEEIKEISPEVYEMIK